MKKKANNKGFSLVELIVVVLIMSILAVSMAPQVMKWVDNARKGVDRQTADAVVSMARLSLTDSKAYSAVTSGGYKIVITSSGTTIKHGDTTPGTSDAFVKAFCENAGVDAANPIPSIALKTGETVTVTISNKGVVTSDAEDVIVSDDFDN